MKRKQLKLWYHIALMNLYGILTDSIEDDPEEGMSTPGERRYLRYFSKYVHHQSKVRELKGA
ncbi:hypothetical protein [Paenibacillus sp. GYB003]|uniref:hypothetical protein n=1 Tax=Paenibacillus sp. GYB003 TaxID=2994392 RepID=UPI002F960AC0